MNRKYVRLEKVGQGTYGTVFKAQDRNTEAIVALKVIPLQNEEEGVPCTTLREIYLLKELQHPNIVKLLDVVYGESALTLVFEYAEYDLQKLLEKSGALPPSAVQNLMKQLLLAVGYCHTRSVLHRDLKPQNILVNKDFELKLADFGLGRAVAVPVSKHTSDVVTLWYRSPDVLLGNTNYHSPVDIWSLGCIFGEMCTGSPLFTGKTATDQLNKIFAALGAPNETSWPSAKTYPNSELLNSCDCRPSANLSTTAQKLQRLGELGIDLLSQMLQYEPSRRITVEQALLHPYFATPIPDE